MAAVAIAPRADDLMGEIGVACVVPRDRRAPPTLDDLRAHAAELLARHKLPEAIVVVDALPSPRWRRSTVGAWLDTIVESP